MAKYGKSAQEKVKENVRKYKKGTLKSSGGDIVTSRKQAIATGLSEVRQAGGKVPHKSKPEKQSGSSGKGKNNKKPF